VAAPQPFQRMRRTRVTDRLLSFPAITTILVCSIGLTSCGSSGNTFTAPSTLSKCAVTVDGPSNTLPAGGGGGTINVQTERECQWTAQPEVPWLSISAGASGQGPGAVQFNATANADPATRTGGVMVNGQRAQIAQAPGECHFELSSNATELPRSGGSGSVDVRASSALCTWTAVSTVEWITINSNANGKGSAPVTFTVAATTGPPRTATVTIAGQHFSVTQAEGCNYAVSPTTYSVGTSGGTQTVMITTSAGCPWTAASNADWISIGPATGSGTGNVTVTVAAANGPSRLGAVTVAGQTVTITQGDGCTFVIAPDSQSVASSGGNGSVTVTAGAGCAWTATSAQSWITITSGSSGNGNGTLNFTVAATSGPARSGTMTIAGRTFTINQGQGCSFSLATTSASAPASGASGSFDVRTADDCGWAANSNANWLSITAGATGSGNGTVRYTAAANTGPQRTGTLTAGGQTFTVTQSAGCTYSIAPPSQNVASGGGPVSVDVTSPSGCAWTAVSNAPWLGISSGGNGSGNGTVQIAVAANPDGERRGTATIAGQTYTVVQASGCSFSLSPTSSQLIPAAGGGSSFNVNTNASCAWTAVANAGWISVTSGANGNGPGSVQFAAAANSGSARSGTITAAGQTFTVSQDSGCSATVAPDTMTAPAAGGSQTVNISTAADCAWSAASNAPWIAVAMPTSGSGNGTVRLDIQANTDAARTGTATIAGRVVTVNQDSGCTITLTPSSTPMVVGGGPGSVTVTAGANCTWTAVSGAGWITFPGPNAGSGSGTLMFNVDANTTGVTRSGSITIGGQVFTVNQAGT
jgi:Viral BACON domain/Putative binding domain, N-terminal